MKDALLWDLMLGYSCQERHFERTYRLESISELKT
jgi:hypothetical protein